MSKPFTRKYKKTLILALCILCCAMIGCVEASFELAKESRLPKWITIPPGLTRSDVSVTMNYYIGQSGRAAEFILKNKKGKVLTKIKGTLGGLYPLRLKNTPPGSDPLRPSYEVITVNGITEVIEHKKREPIFYVSDDPAVRNELLAAPGSDK